MYIPKIIIHKSLLHCSERNSLLCDKKIKPKNDPLGYWRDRSHWARLMQIKVCGVCEEDMADEETWRNEALEYELEDSYLRGTMALESANAIEETWY